MTETRSSKFNLYIVLIHVLFWTLLISSPLFFYFNFNFRLIPTQQFILLNGLIIIIFYINYSLFIPLFFFRKRFILYFISIVALLAGVIFLTKELEGTLLHSMRKEFIEDMIKLYPRENLLQDFAAPKKPRLFMLFTLVLITIGSSIKITSRWLSDEKEKIAIKKEKINAELSYLKSQIDPHFFFNTLNNIYSLTQLKSDKAPQTILKLSELMRYNIYEADKEYVFLKEEINYIQNFIDLQRIRLAKSVDIDFYVRGNIGEKKIEPLLFLPFIENAFKHGIDYANNCSIDIEITVEDTEITLLVINSISDGNKKISKQSGVGLSNIYKRLELLYKDKHTLTINENDKRFMVKLILEINDH
ncbi:hypothetical protein E9993_12220 [Labilibacter sediminis]|nr:hypothetical protein E9993_12220 [Labilibacter sediminis]